MEQKLIAEMLQNLDEASKELRKLQPPKEEDPAKVSEPVKNYLDWQKSENEKREAAKKQGIYKGY
ncbi:hypothetical protein [Pedobacter glucosidilyticus]|uniref:hypothetical protein n=1 Tax=Pedobacter glucosidilyticus TaxID=1122941 RepID=UPI0004191ABB|nr:hypothetical protein [Pedobacter glucosidilyticus]